MSQQPNILFMYSHNTGQFIQLYGHAVSLAPLPPSCKANTDKQVSLIPTSKSELPDSFYNQIRVFLSSSHPFIGGCGLQINTHDQVSI